MRSSYRVAIAKRPATELLVQRRLRETMGGAKFIFAAALISLAALLVPADRAYASIWLMPNLAGLAALTTCFILEYRRMGSSEPQTWHSPQPVHRPPNEALQSAWCLRFSQLLMAAGLMCAIIDWVVWPMRCSWECPVALGAGIWGGYALWCRYSNR